MKSKLLFLVFGLLITFSSYGQFQKTIGVTNKHYHDLNMESTNDGSNDFIVAGNLFDSTLQNEELTLKRVDQNGVVVWIKKYTHNNLVHARVFDMVLVGGSIYITGSIDVSGVRKVFISEILASNGNFVTANYYEIIGPNFNSRGLKIVHTQSDANNDGVPDPGFVVGGFFSDCYAVDINCNFNNIGFILRTDNNLNHIWTTEIDANNPINSAEYDFVNGITETNDGFFITGSATGITPTSSVQQGVLAHKLDFSGVFMWDSSYIFGNASDVSTDAYFDVGSNQIYVLVNYSISHYFGVIVLNNVGGASTLHWVATGSDLDKYGFRIMESANSASNLVISGYDRNESWTNTSGSFSGQSTIFVYEFTKATGTQVGASYQYLVPHTEPAGDEFNFWSGQLPLIYYPDISQLYVDTGGNANYYHVGYRTNPSATFTETELYKTPLNFRNECDHLALQLTPNTGNLTPIQVTSGQVPTSVVSLILNDAVIAFQISMCDPALSINEENKNKGGIYPNPASDVVYLTGDNLKTYKVIDASGRTVFMGTLTNEKSIYIGNLAQGMYFVQTFDPNRNMQTFKLIKR
ncbi:MAG: T9SS type A sorting domain-containing protein [Bacteroidota bacterium]